MDIISDEKFQKTIFDVQNILFKKGTKEEAIAQLTQAGITIESLLTKFAIEDNEQKVDLIICLIDLLLKLKDFNSDLITFILTESKKHPDNMLKLTSSSAKKFFIQLIRNYIDSFIKEDFLIKLLKLYLLDQNPGIYESTLNLLLLISSRKDIEQSIMTNVIEYLSNIILSNDSVLLIRKFEVILKYTIVSYPNQSDICNKELTTMASQFHSYDILTQLTFLETMENNITSAAILSLFNPSLHLINADVMSLPTQTLRKLLFTFSKFYARDLLSMELKLIKNTLAISFQYYQDTKMADFICPIILNVFYNKKIYEYLMDSANNTQYDFKQSVIDIIIENYFNHDPNVKMQVLEVFQRMFDFNSSGVSEDNTNANQAQAQAQAQYQIQELFIRDFIKAFVGQLYSELQIKNDDDAMSKFADRLYQDFKKHDLPEYEEQYVNCLMSFTTNKKVLKALLSNFDFVLYLLNRREKPQSVLLSKFNLITAITKSELFSEMSTEFSNQFANYVKRGAY